MLKKKKNLENVEKCTYSPLISSPDRCTGKIIFKGGLMEENDMIMLWNEFWGKCNVSSFLNSRFQVWFIMQNVADALGDFYQLIAFLVQL